ncbi:hypothetical protein Tco_0662312 [Tanacetum coccineum]
MKVEESLNVTFDESPPPPKTSPLVDDDLVKEVAIEVSGKKNLGNDIEDETLEVNEIVNIKESKDHPLDSMQEELNQIIANNVWEIMWIEKAPVAFVNILVFKETNDTYHIHD